MAQLKEGSIIKKSTGAEVIATLNDIPITKISELNYTKVMTQAQYDALSTEEKNRTDVWYGIYEEQIWLD